MLSRRNLLIRSLALLGTAGYGRANAHAPSYRPPSELERFWLQGKRQTDLKPFALKGNEPDAVLIVLMGGDNNLSSFVYEDLKEMAEGVAGSRIAVIALADIAVKPAVVVEVSAQHGIQIIENWPEIDTGDPEVLADFLARALVTYPKAAKSISIWGHGTGIFDEHDKSEKVIKIASLHDDASGGLLTTRETGTMLAAAFARAGLGQPVDFLLWDADLVGMIEVLEEVAPYSQYFVGSQDHMPGDGLDYVQWLSEVRSQATPTAQDWARGAVDAFCTTYEPLPKKQPATLSAFKNSNRIAPAFKQLVSAVREEGELDTFRFVDEVRRAAQRFARRDTYDIKDFASKLAASLARSKPGVARAARNIVTAFDEARVGNCSLGASVARANGLSFWFPSTRSAMNRDIATYEKLAFARYTGWADLLRKLR